MSRIRTLTTTGVVALGSVALPVAGSAAAVDLPTTCCGCRRCSDR